MWAIEFSQEASNYALDSLPYNEAVLIAIEKLAFSQDGLPAEGLFQAVDMWCVWEVSGHTVVYDKSDSDQTIYIWLIKPTQ
jgi:hypothetical protein